MASRRNLWLDLAADALRLNLEAQAVIGLRLTALAGGGPGASEEGLRMVLEKAEAACDAAALVSRCVLAGEAHLAPARTLSLVRRRVRANRRRLCRTRAR